MKKYVVCLIFLGLFCFNLYAETEQSEDNIPPHVTLVFHDIGRNLLGAVTYNYGVNFIGAGLGTWAFIETGTDWKWRNIAYDNPWMSTCGRPGLYLGYIVPGLTPIALYAAGRFADDKKLLITGLALAQSLLLTLTIQTPLKMITGRALPGIVDELDHKRNPSTDDFSGEFNWFNNNFIAGWPSGHTANAFAAAATISELYKDNFWLKLGVYSYATLIGVGIAMDVHWASEVWAGALIGYAVGKTVGKSFNQLLEKKDSDHRVSLYAAPNALGVVISF
ncbi:MAG: phosphatase PAP2 family protein [Treponema sp.]|jgi:membrane-associated phospholipid phosphatase|nr:phosphatase PAP2 family protein [Treponema sp.]